MIAHIWKLSLLIISVCFIVINGTPITTTSTEIRDSDGFNEIYKDSSVIMEFYPIRKRLMKYFTALNNSDLLSARASCESLDKLASEVLNRRIKPIIIINGTVNSTVDQQIISTFKRHMRPIDWWSHYFDDFLTLREWQSRIVLVFDDCNNPTPLEHLPTGAYCLRVVPHDNRLRIHYCLTTNGQLGNNHPRSAVIIPKMYQANVYVTGYVNRRPFPDVRDWKKTMLETKLIIVFRENARSPSDIESITADEIVPYADNRSVSVCYVTNYGGPQIGRHFSYVMFMGRNVETSTFLVETTDEEELREKLLKWKSKLDFLENHYMIPFYFTKESMEPTNGEEIFREIFGIQPATLRLSASELVETGLICWNSTTRATRNPGSVYAIVGFKKF